MLVIAVFAIAAFIVVLKDYMINKGKYPGNKTIFKSMGIGLEDVAAGYVILKNMGIINF